MDDFKIKDNRDTGQVYSSQKNDINEKEESLGYKSLLEQMIKMENRGHASDIMKNQILHKKIGTEYNMQYN